MRSILLSLLLAASPLAMASAQSPFPLPPPPRAEIMPKPPVSEAPLIWQPGHWDWFGGSFAWTPGLWVLRETHGTAWQEGYWSTPAGGGYVWVPAHWLPR